jgi:hypothetical protein
MYHGTAKGSDPTTNISNRRPMTFSTFTLLLTGVSSEWCALLLAGGFSDVAATFVCNSGQFLLSQLTQRISWQCRHSLISESVRVSNPCAPQWKQRVRPRLSGLLILAFLRGSWMLHVLELYRCWLQCLQPRNRKG